MILHHWHHSHNLLGLLVAIVLFGLVVAIAVEQGTKPLALALLAAFVLIMLTGCAALRPAAVVTEFDHVSHATQHFGPSPTNYGYNAVSAGLRWRPVQGMTVDLLEGVVLEGQDGSEDCHGGLWGPREVFEGRIQYEVPLR